MSQSQSQKSGGHRRSLAPANSCDAGGVHGSSGVGRFIGMAGGVVLVLVLLACLCGCLCCACAVQWRLRKGQSPLPWTVRGTPGTDTTRLNTALASEASLYRGPTLPGTALPTMGAAALPTL